VESSTFALVTFLASSFRNSRLQPSILVTLNEKGEVSIFIRRRGGDLPGATKEVVNGCPIHVESTRGFQVAGLQSEQFTVLIASNLPGAENFRLARESATRVA